MAKAMTQPNHVGERRVFREIDGRRVHRTIEDEIIRPQKTSRHGKLIYLQKMRYEEAGRWSIVSPTLCAASRRAHAVVGFRPVLPPNTTRRLEVVA
jgi:hypothetical protein